MEQELQLGAYRGYLWEGLSRNRAQGSMKAHERIVGLFHAGTDPRCRGMAATLESILHRLRSIGTVSSFPGLHNLHHQQYE